MNIFYLNTYYKQVKWVVWLDKHYTYGDNVKLKLVNTENKHSHDTYCFD